MEILIKDFWSEQAQRKLQCMELRAPFETNPDPSSEARREVIFVLDNSNFIPQSSQEVILEDYRRLYDDLFLGEPSELTPGLFVNYSRTVSGSVLLANSHKENKENFKVREPTDRSALSQALRSLADYMEKNTTTKSFTIIICIGGYENMETLDNLYAGIDYLYQVVQDRLVDFHCLGFGDFHDVYLLSKLMRLATSKSSYQYLDSEEDMRVALANIKKMITSPQACFFVHKSEEKYKVIPRWDPKEGYHAGRLYGILPEQENYNFFRRLDARGDIPSGYIERIPEGLTLDQKVDFLRANITSFINNLNNKMSPEVISKSKEVLLNLDKEVDELIKEVNGLGDIRYRPVLFLSQKNRFLITKTMEALDFVKKKTLSVSFIASLISFACSLDTPELYDFTNLTNIDQEILKVASALSYSTSLPFPLEGTSPVRAEEVPAMLTRGDCICVGLRMEGKEPIDVFPEFTSAETFFSAVNSGEKPSDDVRQGERVVNWVFPLYVNRGHWEIGRLKWQYLKELMEIGEDFHFKLLMIVINKQAVLGKDSKEAPDFEKLYDLILETCAEIQKNKKDANKALTETYERYTENHKEREEMVSNCLFCAKVLVGIKAGFLKAPTNNFVACVYEEEMRRDIFAKLKSMPTFQVDNILLTALGVITFWDSLMKSAEPSEVYTHYLVDKMMEDALETSHTNPIIENIQGIDLKKYEKILSDYLKRDLKNKETKDWEKEACYFPIPDFLKHFCQKINQLVPSIDRSGLPTLTFNISTSLPWYRAMLVCNILKRNPREVPVPLTSSHIEGAQDDLNERAMGYLSEKAREVLENKARKEISEIIYKQMESFDAPAEFAKIDNLEGASAILYGKKMGADLKAFLEKLAEKAKEEVGATGTCGAMTIDKLILICTGVYGTVDFRIKLWEDFDTFTKESSVRGVWMPSKKILKKFNLAPEELERKLNIEY